MKVLLPAILIFITSCNYEIKKKDKSADSLLREIEAGRIADSMTKAIIRNINWDTIGLKDAPIQVLKATFFTKEYSNYKDIRIHFKNVSNKKINAIRFRWYGENAFGEPADMGTGEIFGEDGFGAGYDDTPIKPNQSRTSEWSILSRNGKKVVKAWPTEVVFEDGSKWATKSE
jgi:hypothetical protein